MPTLAIPLKDILTDAPDLVDPAALSEAEATAHVKGSYGLHLPEPLHIHRIPLQKS